MGIPGYSSQTRCELTLALLITPKPPTPYMQHLAHVAFTIAFLVPGVDLRVRPRVPHALSSLV